jgi:hypothetical protein
MIAAAIVGLGRWGKTLVEAGKGEGLRFTCAVSRDPDQHLCNNHRRRTARTKNSTPTFA